MPIRRRTTGPPKNSRTKMRQLQSCQHPERRGLVWMPVRRRSAGLLMEGPASKDLWTPLMAREWETGFRTNDFAFATERRQMRSDACDDH